MTIVWECHEHSLFFLFELLDRFCGRAEITVFRELWVVTSFVRLWFVSSVFFSPIGCHDFYDDGWLSFSWNLLENNWIRAPIERVFKFKLPYKHDGIETPLSLRCKLVKVSVVMTQSSSRVQTKKIFCVRLWHFSSQLFSAFDFCSYHTRVKNQQIFPDKLIKMSSRRLWLFRFGANTLRRRR